MADTTKSGVYQLENGMWGFRYTVTYNGKRKDVKRQKDELGRILKQRKQRYARGKVLCCTIE